ncbi:DUF3667 domain-containing protein [Pseudoduganella albidiflava]|uniref:DUF3667 domain-containing protein n=1 Tax=Pseudoduganella albidiflava TaxID=321983 RepID=A0A411WSA9_9BURK|nr:DUF3667 domain-containing protein [Pseudoduganella albidiflava]QBH99527.1 DUF3667 domain-containing protein [Pseudoduganella albidiflava]GGY45526.1 hypothetical protein GCM10007387_29470 [Pseudoduganella albidiflava]
MEGWIATESHRLKPVPNHAPDHHAVPADCRNCGAAVSGNYCAHCGQETRLHMPSLAEFAHEFITHYVALEGKLWGTFTRLLFRPGALTNEYLSGRRRRYVEPLRVYLTLSILFFALVKFSGVNIYSETEPSAPAAATAGAGQGKAAQTEDEDGRIRLGDALGPDVERWAPAVRRTVDRFDSLGPQDKARVLKDGFFRYAPYAMFFLMPVFALYLKGLYLGTGRRYGEHLLFALHANAFAFAVFSIFLLMPDGFIKFMLFCWLIGYLPWAMQRVYRKGLFGTAWRWAVLMALHLLSVVVAIVAAAFLGVAMAP